MAAPTKEDVLSELAALGVEAQEDEKMPELQAKLRNARAAAEASAEAAKVAPEAQANVLGEAGPQADGTAVKGKGELVTFLENVTHNHVSYKKGEKARVSAADVEALKAKNLVA